MLNIRHFQILKLKYVNKYTSSLAHKKNSLYLCNVFFMVLDLRLTIDGRRDDGHLFLSEQSCHLPWLLYCDGDTPNIDLNAVVKCAGLENPTVYATSETGRFFSLRSRAASWIR